MTTMIPDVSLLKQAHPKMISSLHSPGHLRGHKGPSNGNKAVNAAHKIFVAEGSRARTTPLSQTHCHAAHNRLSGLPAVEDHFPHRPTAHRQAYPILKDAKILIVDDELSNVRFLETVLQQAGYGHLQSTTDACRALPLFISFQPDIVLLDLNMPHQEGLTVMQQLRSHMSDNSYVPILVLTTNVRSEAIRKALRDGAQDFLTKPFDPAEVLLRITNLLVTRFQNLSLAKEMRQHTRQLEEAQLETLQRLALAAEYRDDDTGVHTRRVGKNAARIAAGLGLPRHQVDLIHRTAPLHDIGKIGISDAILLKPGELTKDEFATMKTHTVVGAKMLSGSRSPWLQMAEEVALTHHERWDGKGYIGVKGEAIPLVGRIVAVADVFDALTHERPYKKAWPVPQAVAEIEAQAGRQFDPRVVEVFLTLSHEMLV